MDVYRQIKVSKSRKETNLMDDDTDEESVIMEKGKPCDFFVLILEGRVEIAIGKEEHKFYEGPFSYYGEAMLEGALVPRWAELLAIIYFILVYYILYSIYQYNYDEDDL